MSNQSPNALDAIESQLKALMGEITKLKSTPPPAPPSLAEQRRQVRSTAAERIRQYVLQHGKATTPELTNALKVDKQAVHYYAEKLAADGRIKLGYAPHEASHSLVKEMWQPLRVVELDPKRFPSVSESDVEAMLELLASRQAARAKTG